MSTTISGTTGIDKVQDGTTINASSIMGALNASGTAPIYACRAWVNFNGTGTVAIRASGNVSSITDTGTGNYTVNLITAMPDANYVKVVSTSPNYGVIPLIIEVDSFGGTELAPTTTAFGIFIQGTNASAYDAKYVNVSVFR